MITTPLPAGSLRATSLNAARRASELPDAAGGRADVLVIGGGVLGCAVALDAAARGLSAVLLEAADLAGAGPGLPAQADLDRLARGDVPAAHTQAAERAVLLNRTAPHLVATLPRLVPLRDEVSRRTETALTAGLRTADVLRRAARTPSDVLPPPRRIPAAEALALVPGLRRTGLRAGLLGYAGQIADDARLAVALARTAAGFGARVLTRVRVAAADARGADAVDELTGERLRVDARAVVNAAGTQAGGLVPAAAPPVLHETRLLVDADAAGLAGTALLLPDRLLLAPQPDGTALISASGKGSSATHSDNSTVDDVLSAAGAVLGGRLGRADVLAQLSGPRVATRRGQAEPDPVSGVVTALDADPVTCRRTAAAAVDAAVRAGGLAAGPSRTAAVALVGAAPREQLPEIGAHPRLLARYGTESARIAALTELDPDLADEVYPGLTAAEVVWAVRHELALDADDVLQRRSAVGRAPAARSAAAPAVESLVHRAMRGVAPEDS
ncbi:FAD-dependent oxidoreductase [Saccharopolyspora sp. HNM0983]|uniref:FAD-dependent oxidoreductase n=1 Tax=Saccharopolyspora montiporae TaxID=2781240 RepID=A0A929B9F5_9PSEU|nr:FAD-dependent oxidoreductase [Saccharopolyspora sp. HNM0983]MBE9373993.1 FAD-dependent oxidoreductase [Saccharopolyspora sp. HNM0983]